MIRVLLFDDNKSYRESLGLFLASSEQTHFCGSYPDANDVVAVVGKHKPEVILMDIQMPGVSGIEALQKIKTVYPTIKVLIQTSHEDDNKVFSAICSGASGYILKSTDPDDILQAIKDVNSGGSNMSPIIAAKVLKMFQNQFVKTQPTYIDLTDREREVLAYMVRGMSYKMIADACVISYHTVHYHIKNIYEKLHVNSAPEAVAKAIENKLV